MEENQLEKELKALQDEEAQLNKVLDHHKGLTSDREHLNLIHEYNDLKDAAQAVMGLLADIEVTTVTDIHKRFGIEAQDGNN